MFKFFLCSILFFLPQAKAQSFMPDNDLHLDDGLFSGTVSREIFDNTIAKLTNIYAPIAEKFGKKIVIQGDWDDSTVNAYAYQSGNVMYVEMFGGLARRPEITPDGFALVICHEIGHHLAGYPMYSSYGSRWAAIEGQSDYYSTNVCYKKLNRIQFPKDPVPKFAMDKCTMFDDDDDYNACVNSVIASKSIADLLASFSGKKVSYTTPDKTVVSTTQEAHPRAQCRLDTYVAGSLCGKVWDDSVIPTQKNQHLVNCDNRPKCWFKN